MSYFESFNEDGRLQLSAEKSILSFVGNGQATTKAGDYNVISSFSVSYTIQPGGGLPIIAVAPADFSSLSGSYLYDGVYTATYNSELPIGSVVPYWIFDQVPATPLNFGMELRDASNNLIYSVGRNPLRITNSLINNDEGVYTYVPGRQYAAALSSRAYRTNVFMADVYEAGRPYSADCAVVDSKSICVKSINNGIQIKGRGLRDGIAGGASYYNGYNKNSNIMIVDVTNYGLSAPGGNPAVATGSLSEGYYVARVSQSTSWTCTANISNATVASYNWSIRGFGHGIGLNWSISSGQNSQTAVGTMTVNDPSFFNSAPKTITGAMICYVTMTDGTTMPMSSPIFVTWTGSGGGSPSPSPSGGAPSFNYPPGEYYPDDYISIQASSDVTWTYTLSGNTARNSTSPASGSTSRTLTSQQLATPQGKPTGCVVSLTGSWSGGSGTWSLHMQAYGDGGDGCVDADSYMPDGRQAHEYEEGDDLLVLDYSTMASTTNVPVEAIRFVKEESYRITSESGITLVASRSTPLTLRDGTVINILEGLGVELPVQDENGFRWEKIIGLDSVGLRRVAYISANNQNYAAGETPNRFIFTHNIEQKQIQ